MFLITSITTLRERTTATLERLMTMPLGKLDLLFGYAIAFGIVATTEFRPGLAIIAACALAALILGAATLRRRTP